ncbi:MAG: crossover junction endodeoxyribonuclease RuvC [bacterium]|nr:crossover junction endodeoxyribonuclease RuvC [bacterium]
MIILGVDPGSHATGYGVIRTSPVARMLAGGVIRTNARAPLADRLLTIHDALVEVIAGHDPEAMVVEDLFNARNPRSALVLGHARGVILLAGARAGLPVHEYAPRDIKKAVTGNGGAAKEQVRFMVMRLLGLREEPPLDQSDALAAALAYAGRSRRFPDRNQGLA